MFIFCEVILKVKEAYCWWDIVIVIVIDSDGDVVMCLENDSTAKEQEKKDQQRIYESFRSGPFEDIVARSEANVILHISVSMQY